MSPFPFLPVRAYLLLPLAVALQLLHPFSHGVAYAFSPISSGCHSTNSFLYPRSRPSIFQPRLNTHTRKRTPALLFAASPDDTEQERGNNIPLGLPAADLTSTSSTIIIDDDTTGGNVDLSTGTGIDTGTAAAAAVPPSAATTTFMITSDMKRTLIEELGFTRNNVECMRVELAGPIITKRLRCPPEGMPAEWLAVAVDEGDGRSNNMLQRLENESRYPLKFPLLAVSLVLFGKGLSDAIVTIIKVQQGFRGASLAEQFMGVPVLGIDALCVVLGAALGVWTLKTMRDDDSTIG